MQKTQSIYLRADPSNLIRARSRGATLAVRARVARFCGCADSRSLAVRAALLTLLLWAMVVPGFAAAQPTDLPARAASLVVYHVSPDPRAGAADADPLARAEAPSPPSARLPYTLIDGVEPTDPAPEGRPESAFAHFREMQRLVDLRKATGAPVALTLDVGLEEGTATARVLAQPAPGAVPPQARLRVVLVEDGAPLTTPEGARTLRYVARVALPAENLTYGTTVERSIPLAPEWQRARLGVVAVVETIEGETLQSATWISGQGEVRASSRMVLVEHVTATWCAPCEPADEAFALLASQVGLFDDAASGPASYLRPPTTLLVVGALLGAAAGALLLRRRAA